MLIRSRRDFLKATLKSVTALSAMSKFGEMNALAAGSSGYQALVCIFLAGGNDGHNTVIPITTAQQNYSLYATNRGPLALAQSSLLPIAAGNDTYGLHPSLVGNSEPLQREKSRHSRQRWHAGGAYQSHVLFGSERGSIGACGSVFALRSGQPMANVDSQWPWRRRLGRPHGGLIADRELRRPVSPVTSISGCGLFCTGQNTLPATVP